MHEDALSFVFMGGSVFAYGLCVTLGAALALLFFAVRAQCARLPAGTAPLFAVTAIPFGILASRLLFAAFDFRFHTFFTLRALFSFWGGGFSMVGALLGITFSAWITGRIQKVPWKKLMDLLAPALLLFIGFERIGEGFTELLGRSRTLVSPLLTGSCLAQSDGYSSVLRTYLLEAVCAFLLSAGMLFVSLRAKHSGDTLRIAMLLYGCTQVFFESLRFDGHMRQSFISFQQIFYALMFAIPLLKYAVGEQKRANLHWPVPLSLTVLVLLTGAVVALEFLIDRSGISRILLYAVYAVLLSVPVILGLLFRQRSKPV